MRQILVLKDVAYAAKTGGGTIAGMKEINSLTDGALVIMNELGVKQACAGAVIASTTDKLIFAAGTADSYSPSDMSHIIDRRKITHIKRVTFRPAVNPIVFLGSDGYTANLTSGAVIANVEYEVAVAGGATLDLGTVVLEDQAGTRFTGAIGNTLVVGNKYKVITAGTPATWGTLDLLPTASTAALNIGSPAVGDYAQVLITKTKYGQVNGKATPYSHTIVAGDTDASILADLVDKINADTVMNVTASVVTGNVGIKVVSNDNTDLLIMGQGALEDASIIKGGAGASLAYMSGVLGEAADVAYFEDEFSVHKGNEKSVNKLTDTWSKLTNAVAATNYDIYAIDWRSDANDPINTNFGVVNHTLYIAIPTAAGTFPQANFNVIFDALKI